MALIDVYCATCDRYAEVVRRLSEWPATPPCPTCGGPTEQRHLPPRVVTYVDPVVVYRAPDGSLRYPGETGGTSTGKYERMGYQRVELRGALEVRRFEKQVNTRMFSEACRRTERLEQLREQGESLRRSDLRQRMSSMSARGRDFARAAMRHTDQKPRQRAQESGFYSEVYSVDRSNREASVNERGQRRRD
jgi:hypothetical protein